MLLTGGPLVESAAFVVLADCWLLVVSGTWGSLVAGWTLDETVGRTLLVKSRAMVVLAADRALLLVRSLACTVVVNARRLLVAAAVLLLLLVTARDTGGVVLAREEVYWPINEVKARGFCL